MLANLTPEQQLIARDLIGTPFTFSEVERHIQEAKRGYDEWLKKKEDSKQ